MLSRCGRTLLYYWLDFQSVVVEFTASRVSDLFTLVGRGISSWMGVATAALPTILFPPLRFFGRISPETEKVKKMWSRKRRRLGNRRRHMQPVLVEQRRDQFLLRLPLLAGSHIIRLDHLNSTFTHVRRLRRISEGSLPSSPPFLILSARAPNFMH